MYVDHSTDTKNHPQSHNICNFPRGRGEGGGEEWGGGEEEEEEEVREEEEENHETRIHQGMQAMAYS